MPETLKVEKKRPLTEDEKRTLQDPFRARTGILSHIAYYGGHIILIPAMFGGMFAALLSWTFGLGEDRSFIYGIFIACVVSLASFLYFENHARTLTRRHNRKRTAALEKGVVYIYDLNICEAWDFDYIEDTRMYVFRLDTGDFAYMASELVTGIPDEFPREHVRVEVLPEVGSVLSLHVHGRQVEGVEVDYGRIEMMGASPLFDPLMEGYEFGISGSDPFLCYGPSQQ